MNLNKKLIVVTLILLSIFMISAVSAATDTTETNVNSDVTHTEKLTTTTDDNSDNSVKTSKSTDIGTDDSLKKTEKRSTKNDTDNNLKETSTPTNKIKTSTSNEDLLKDADPTPVNDWNSLKNAAWYGGNFKLTNNITTNGEYISIRSGRVVTINGNGYTIDAEEKGTDGIFRVSNGATLILENLKIINGNSTNPGGAIIADKSYINITNCTFNNNKAIGTSKYGGAIEAHNSYINITNCTFNNNKVIGSRDIHGGAIDISNSQANITNCNFTNNAATESGGAIEVGGTSQVNITNCKFTNNAATDGGAIYMRNGNININNSNFTNNKANSSSAIHITNGNNANIHKCTFTNNNVECYEGSVDLSDSKIINTHQEPNNNPTNNEDNKNTTTQPSTTTPNETNNNPTKANPTSQPAKVTKQTIKIIASKKTFKRKVKVKKYTVTLKQGNKAINKATVTLKVKGKKYTAKTNKNGKSTFKITKLNKKGTYKAVISYKGTKKTVKIIIK